MAVPDLVKILFYRFDHTDAIGHFAGGQFFADAGSLSAPERVGPSASPYYTVLHLFDDDGRQVDSVVEVASTESEFALAQRRLHHLLDGLPDRWYTDIAVRPFRVEAHGHVFGLIDESADGQGDLAVVYPGGLMFRPPWHGIYDCDHDRVAPRQRRVSTSPLLS